jgi:peptidoglycan hydrolase-like protein with peptidoglycan-binding domain
MVNMTVDRTRNIRAPADSTPIHSRRVWERAPNEKAVTSGKSALMLGHQGDMIRRLQELLNEAGASPPLVVDHRMGPAVERAVVDFQRKHHLDDDGMAGHRTWRRLQEHVAAIRAGAEKPGSEITDPSRGTFTAPRPLEPGPSGVRLKPAETPELRPAIAAGDIATAPGRANGRFDRDRAAREAQGEAILRANGQWPPVDGRIYVIQIDQDSPPPPKPAAKGLAGAARSAEQKRYNDEKQRVINYLRRYTGEAVVFKATGGRLVEKNAKGPFRAAAHPGQLVTKAAPDVNGDGKSDIAHLRSGVYEYQGKVNGSNRYDPVSDMAMKVARDLNQDGVIDPKEAQRDDYGLGIQIHSGNAGGPSSIGCQTFEPNDYIDLKKVVHAAKAETFTYVLVRRPNDLTGENPF